ncbi:MAG: serine/threonine-protein kinase [Acidobacteriota bacterium]
MTPQRWQEVKHVLDQVLDREPSEREPFLDLVCADDPALRAEIDSLLHEDDTSEHFLDTPVYRLVDDNPEPLRAIGRYQVDEELGRGGMGTVYRVRRQDDYQQTAALKLLKRGMDTDEILRRFRTERQILAQLEHPNIARLLDGGSSQDGRPFLVVEYVEGVPIDSYCDGLKLSIGERLELFLKVCDAVQYAHRHLVVHRDLKPSNILVDSDGVPKLLDFGIAKLLGADSDMTTIAVTTDGQRFFTPDYASPEQIRGEPVSTASDVYSLGVLLYELLTGHRPYRVPTANPRVASAVFEQQPVRPSTIVTRSTERHRDDGETLHIEPEIVSSARGTDPHHLQKRLRGDLDAIVMQALEHETKRRYSTVDRFAEDLRHHLEGKAVSARPQGVVERSQRFAMRNWRGLAVAAMILMLLTTWGFREVAAANEIARGAQTNERAFELMDIAFGTADPNIEQGEEVSIVEAINLGLEELRNLDQEPRVQSVLYLKIGRILRVRGDLLTARRLLEQSVALHRELYGDRNGQTAVALHELALVNQDDGDSDRARDLAEEALTIQRRLYSTPDDDIANGLNNLAMFLRSGRQYEEAESAYREALRQKVELLETTLDPEVRTRLRKSITGTRNNLGTLLTNRNIKRYEEGDELLRRALDERRELYEPNDTHIANTLNNLGVSLKEQNRFTEGAEHLRVALNIRQSLLPEHHISILESYNNLGSLYNSANDLENAASIFSLALDALDARTIANLPIENATTAAIYTNAGDVMIKLERYEEAIDYLLDAERIFQRLDRTLNVAVVKSQLAKAHLGRSDPATAISYARQSVVLAKGAPVFFTAGTNGVLGEVLVELGEMEEGRALIEMSHTQLVEANASPKQLGASYRRVYTLYSKLGDTEKLAAIKRELLERPDLEIDLPPLG